MMVAVGADPTPGLRIDASAGDLGVVGPAGFEPTTSAVPCRAVLSVGPAGFEPTTSAV
jgi:hypothetical protein